MKILMTTDTVGGVWTYCLELARALGSAGVEIILATMGPPPTAQQSQEAASLPNVQVEQSVFKLEWMDDPWDEVDRANDWLINLQQRHRSDIIHLNGYCHAALPWQAPVLVTGHSCVLSWHRAVKGRPADESQWGEYRRRVRAGLQAADLVVAPTQAMLSALGDNYGPLPRTAVVANGRDGTLFRQSTKSPMYFTAGRLWDEAKNLEVLRQIERHLPWPLHVAGEIRNPQGQSRAATFMSHQLGRLDTAHLAGWLSRASIFVLPAKYEPFGLSPLEAGLSGCALVLGDIDSLREVWGNAATYVRPDDADALLITLTALAREDKHRDRLAKAALRRSRQLTPQRMADSYMALYRRLLRTAGAGNERLKELSLPPRSLRPPGINGLRSVAGAVRPAGRRHRQIAKQTTREAASEE